MKLTVTLPEHAYDILIEKESLTQIGSWVSSLWTKQKICIITDDTVQLLYGNLVFQQLKEQGFDTVIFSVIPGETSKSISVASDIVDFLAENGFTRTDGILALGGGVVGDLAGFVASIYMRGIHYLQVPTTLLAQVDSSIGGKTAVNTEQAKNLIGSFWQPEGVLVDPLTLNTLEVRRIREGIAEIIKSAAIADASLWSRLEALENEQALLEDAEAILTACLKIKQSVVEEDVLDNGNRLILNFGHTIGHAIEATAGYGVVTHGEGVAIGMTQITRIAEKKGLTAKGTTEKLTQMSTKFGLPTQHSPWEKDALFQAITHDKKTRGNTIKLILLETIGQAKIQTIETPLVNEFLVIKE
ncbi:3-dehydroquinate synthase [Enterococcus phoeniculicola]|jgi:3-dehydroquinate synthase|uniref:3-dehydroquinate synthase n=1 Tax=Enterococcus phoeniculicola ATCC BAA-412 TaxID=1158610 RepID=R3WWR2_9ENTE|nr:3-dehydroquinate synthase [Enterococcus phoeniculicola]EOL46215.1 3-dehydroquinate synthase [Enterococcus phoeniculicola ATCC BAA-412]EOT76940.1 3-dehydroquinate synthase [Enterococcus phoeniculicola ATCC BAA-412]OJG71209.1 3-dehydroquinate synthase [Enterococcus phoeniculicola]